MTRRWGERGTVSRAARPRWRYPRIGRSMLCVGLVFVLLLTTIGEANAMGKMCLFSAVRGVVLDHGRPVEGARIEQDWEWDWNATKGHQEAVTDQQGAFALSSVWRRSLLASLLPHEPVVVQTILIHFSGKTCKAWMFDKHTYRENGELGNRPIKIVCRLEAEVTHHGKVYGICQPQ